ncbi:uncharacterized protein FIBRA_01889 [Fibroporia radiculosa]|uniref:ATP-dependent DNA helicase n=1 Tax=Fibroporia radiculosa TaxID=599839 RepID=J4H1I3_9APHY|nr:uncharacterized protein FIBRA_01889 [Fibroporia radiculosa]CCL99864.1 predicted protein [Fibroporia radiculosa]
MRKHRNFFLLLAADALSPFPPSVNLVASQRHRNNLKGQHCCYATHSAFPVPQNSPPDLVELGFLRPKPQEPSNSLGLTADDLKAEHALKEAVRTLKTPRQLRLFFVHLLVNSCVRSPISTWHTFQDAFALDHIVRSDNINIGVNQALEEIGRSLEEHGKSLGVYGLPEPAFHSREVELEFAQWKDREFLATRAAKATAKLNAEQYQVYSEILDAVDDGRPLCAFVDGKAGRGKTFLVNAICNKLRSLGRIVLPTATSGFASQLYPGGKTTHSTFKVPVDDEIVDLESPIEAHDPRGELIREAAVIIWDEAPMAKSSVLKCVEETCRRVMCNDLPFGGKVVVLLGDFRQTCPVIRHGTRRQIVNASILSSPLWRQFSLYRLTQPVRNAEDMPFAEFVDSIGDGAGPHVPLDMLGKVSHRDELIDFVYPQTTLADPVKCLKRAILAPTNDQVDEYNEEILSRIDGVQRTYQSADSLKEDEEIDGVSPETVLKNVERMPLPGVPSHGLTVKANGVYRLMCNYAPDRGLVKNTRVVIKSLGKRIITVRILRGLAGVSVLDAEDILISRISFTTPLESGHTLVRRQFPLSPAYATTFNSCQGLTLDVVGVDLTRPVFSHGFTMPMLGFGVAYGFDKPIDTKIITKPALLEAFKTGYRHVDTARSYRNEIEVGEAIEASGLKRDDLFVTTKIHSAIHGFDNTIRTVDSSLNDMGLDYIDLYLIHDPKAGSELRLETYKALLEAKRQGKIRSVGVSNYSAKHLEEIVAAGYELPSVNQIELHPFCQQKPIVNYCKAHSIIIQAYCPIVRGRLDNSVILGVARKYNKDPAQILLRWSLQHGFVPLPKSSQPARIYSNAALYDFHLTEGDMSELDALDKGNDGAISWNPVDVD